MRLSVPKAAKSVSIEESAEQAIQAGTPASPPAALPSQSNENTSRAPAESGIEHRKIDQIRARISNNRDPGNDQFELKTEPSKSNPVGTTIAQRLQNDDVCSLPDVSSYRGTDVDTHVVVQREAHFLHVGSGQVKKGIATIGAGPCAILIAVVRDDSNQIRKIGMAHVDSQVKKDGFEHFFDAAKSCKNVEVTLLGGDFETAKNALEAADRTGASVVFSCANIGARTDDDVIDAVVDTSGKIYNGMLTFKRPPESLMERMQNVDVSSHELLITSS